MTFRSSLRTSTPESGVGRTPSPATGRRGVDLRRSTSATAAVGLGMLYPGRVVTGPLSPGQSGLSLCAYSHLTPACSVLKLILYTKREKNKNCKFVSFSSN